MMAVVMYSNTAATRKMITNFLKQRGRQYFSNVWMFTTMMNGVTGGNNIMYTQMHQYKSGFST